MGWGALVVSIDDDPGASEVHQLNRITLMVATAHRASGASGRLSRWDLDDYEDLDPEPATGV